MGKRPPFWAFSGLFVYLTPRGWISFVQEMHPPMSFWFGHPSHLKPTFLRGGGGGGGGWGGYKNDGKNDSPFVLCLKS